MKLSALTVALGLSVMQLSCTTLTYLTQAAAGQDDLVRRARSIDELVREKRVDARTRRLLSQVAVIKQFGERHGLKATDNYTKYVRVDRPVVVWVVSAAEPLRFHSKRWSFPIVGSFTYLGWFKLPEARSIAEKLRGEGWDVDLRGSSAYSTEGFFEDSVLSTMIPPGKQAIGDLAETLLHESTHATFFVKHQSTLNESVANFVGDRLGEAYLEETLGPNAPETTAYQEETRRVDARDRALQAAYEALQKLYASDAPDAQKLAIKEQFLSGLRGMLRFRRPINNATLIQFKTYNSGQKELAALLAACQGDWPRFIGSLKHLESTSFPTPQEKEIGPMIQPLVDAGCPR